MNAPLRRIWAADWGRWWRVFYEKRTASQRLFVTLSPMTASTSGYFLWRNRINGHDGEGSVLRMTNNFKFVRRDEFSIRIAEGRSGQRAAGRGGGQAMKQPLGQKVLPAARCPLRPPPCYLPAANFPQEAHRN